MENQVQQNEGVQKKVRIKYKKTITVVTVIVVLFLVFIGLGIFKQWQMRRGVEKFAQTLKQLEQEDYQRAMADTYGGKTPQETLQMYIDAVKKSDFELASKYFIGANQEEWRKELADIKAAGKIDVFLSPIKTALQMKGEYSMDRQSFSIYEPVAVDFLLYPNGIWKITKI